MAQTLSYIVDEAGQKTSVLVPVELWNKLNHKYQKLQRKLAILNDIEAGLKEVADAKQSGKKLQTLSDLLK